MTSQLARHLASKHLTVPIYLWEKFRINSADFSRVPPIIIYQFGKVGSSSVFTTLKHHKAINNPVFHIHCMSDQVHQKVDALRAGRQPTPHHLLVGKVLNEKLNRESPRCFIICIVRDAISWYVSGVFQNLHRLCPEAIGNDGIVNASVITNHLISKFSDPEHVSDYLRDWFFREVYPLTGIDVFSTAFDVKQGYSILTREPHSLLIMRTDELSAVFPAAIKRLLGLEEEIPLTDANVGGAKWYSEAYRQTMALFRLPRKTTEAILKTDYMSHFFYDKQDEIRAKWVRDDSAA